jgi:hypothetical protein
MKTTCNICLTQQTELKCNECTFECCYKCIEEWTERSHNCPQCGKFETYDIEYSLIVSEEESIYEYELYDPMYIQMFFDDSSVSTEEVEETLNAFGEEIEETDEEPEEYNDYEYNDDDFSDVEELNDEHPNYNYYTIEPILILPLNLPPPPIESPPLIPSPSPSV